MACRYWTFNYFFYYFSFFSHILVFWRVSKDRTVHTYFAVGGHLILMRISVTPPPSHTDCTYDVRSHITVSTGHHHKIKPKKSSLKSFPIVSSSLRYHIQIVDSEQATNLERVHNHEQINPCLHKINPLCSNLIKISFIHPQFIAHGDCTD